MLKSKPQQSIVSARPLALRGIDPTINGRNDGSVTHEVLEADEDIDSGDMMAAAGRTSTA